jgi:hypothetical protein
MFVKLSVVYTDPDCTILLSNDDNCKDLILQYKDIFSKRDHDLGHSDRVRHRIDMVDETSFKHRYRRIPPSMYNEVRSHLKQLLDNAVIRPSHSPFASAIVIVRKKNGTIRICDSVCVA